MNFKLEKLFILSILFTVSNEKSFDLIPGWDKFQKYVARNSEKHSPFITENPVPVISASSSTSNWLQKILRNPSDPHSTTEVVIGFSFIHEIDEKNVMPTLNLYIVTPQPENQERFGKSQKKAKSQLEKNFLKAKSEALGKKLVKKHAKTVARGNADAEIRTNFKTDNNQDKDTGKNSKDVNVDNVKLLTAFFHNINIRTHNQLNKIAYFESNPKIKTKLSLIAREYKQVFESYLDENKKTTIRSQYGENKIIRSTVDTAARYMRKMLNTAIFETDEKELKTYLNNTIRTKFDHIIKLEYDNICDKFYVCRSGESKTFVDFIVEMLNAISILPVDKIKVVLIAVYKYFATNDFKEIIDDDLHWKLVNSVTSFAQNEPEQMAMILSMFLNTVTSRHVPIDQSEISDEMEKKLIEKTLVLRDWLELSENTINVTQENQEQWNVYMAELRDWINNGTGDIEVIMREMCSYVIDKPLRLVDATTKEKIRTQTRVLFKAFYEKEENVGIPYEESDINNSNILVSR